MTVAAREVLEDCSQAVAGLVDGLQGNEWRRQWILAIALLRAVGHVLDNVDGKRTPKYRIAITNWWKSIGRTKPDPTIFWQFIEQERNLILKEYQMNAGQGVSIRVPLAYFNVKTGEEWTTPPLPTLYHYTINAGPYKGRDQRNVLKEGIEWWANQLNAIDEAASEV